MSLNRVISVLALSPTACASSLSQPTHWGSWLMLSTQDCSGLGVAPAHCTYTHGTEHIEWDRMHMWQHGKEEPMPFLALVGAMGESMNVAHVGSPLPVVQRLLYNQVGTAACHYAQHFQVTAGTPSQPGSAGYY